MFHYTYFIITPGVEIGSYVQYRNVRGNYIKFGDSQNAHETNGGIRNAYLTHNPDIGICAVMDSQVFQNPGLGTRLKNYVVSLGYETVGATEWFSLPEAVAWSIARDMLGWDRRVLVAQDEQTLKTMLGGHLGQAGIQAPKTTKQLCPETS